MFKLKIKEFRLERNLSQEQLAERSGLSQQYISSLEKGNKRHQSPTLKTIIKLSQAIDKNMCPLELIHCPICDDCIGRKNCTNKECIKL